MAAHLNDQGFYTMLTFPKGRLGEVFEKTALEMVVVHNIILRAINSLLHHAPKLNKNDVPSFMRYSLVFVHTVHHHHANEEELYFPMLEEKLGKGYMGSNIAGHDAFHAPFDEFTALCTKVSKEPSTWNATTFVASVHAFAAPLVKHLAEEIDTLDATILRKSMTAEELEECNIALGKRIQKETSLTEHFPLAITNNDNVSGGWLIPLPWFMKAVIAWVIVPMNGSVWKYGTADGWGNLKPEFAWMSCPAVPV
ncbi:hypothetical protein DL96DRAFT_1628443 [Flagelloscypha sp. PMI_526]|nr:hypothetical protein DL96DRAFT_1628443 [Flagelloscypha sp. PMI_526]